MCLKDCISIIFDEMPCENSWTWFLNYFRKVRLDQRPISMIEKIGTSATYMAIAAPERIECVPSSEGRMPSFVSPMATMSSLIRLDIISDVMLMILFLCWAKETGESLLVPLYARICVIMMPIAWLGTWQGLPSSTVVRCLIFCRSFVVQKWWRHSPPSLV